MLTTKANNFFCESCKSYDINKININKIKNNIKILSLKKHPILLSATPKVNKQRAISSSSIRLRKIVSATNNKSRNYKDITINNFLLIKRSFPIVNNDKLKNQFIEKMYQKLFKTKNIKQKTKQKNSTPFEKLHKNIRIYKNLVEEKKNSNSESFINERMGKKVHRAVSCYKIRKINENKMNFEKSNIFDKTGKNCKFQKDFRINCYYNKINLKKYTSILEKLREVNNGFNC